MLILIDLVFLVVYVFAIHWAAEYAEADEATYLKCFIVSIIITVVQIVILLVMAKTPFFASTLALVVSIAICMKVLKIPKANFVMFTVMLAFLNLITSGVTALVINGMSKSL